MKKGDILYAEFYQKGKAVEVKEVVITKVGRLFFYINVYGRDVKYSISTLKYAGDHASIHSLQLYLTKQEILDKYEMYNLKSKLSRIFNSFSSQKFKLEQLRKIDEIINENK